MGEGDLTRLPSSEHHSDHIGPMHVPIAPALEAHVLIDWLIG